MILLRSDVHATFDARQFLIVPKNGKWVTHVLYGEVQDELARCFHNVHAQPLTDIAVELIFARFLVEVDGSQHGRFAAQSGFNSGTASSSKRRRDESFVGERDISESDRDGVVSGRSP
ncbi:hypothetical protein E4U54_008775, partial [Claviceps lovelessii]